MKTLDPAWLADAGKVANVATALIALVGFAATLVELCRSTRVRRAQFLFDAAERYFADSDIRKLYYDLDYEGRFEIAFDDEGNPQAVRRGGGDAHPFVGSDEARLLDSLLYNLDSIGRLVEIGALDRRDAAIFAFQARRVFRNPSVVRYLEWLTRERERLGGEAPAHRAARLLQTLASPPRRPTPRVA